VRERVASRGVGRAVGVVGIGCEFEFREEEGGVDRGDEFTLERVRLVGVTDCRGDRLGDVEIGRTGTDFGVVGRGGVDGGGDACRVVFTVMGDVVLAKLRATGFVFF
jgi:hypothetical protein